MASEAKERTRLVAVTLDESSIGRGNPDQEHERAIAIYDILEENTFSLPNYDGGPYGLRISLIEKKLCFEVTAQDGRHLVSHHLSLTPFNQVVKDYFQICESYFDAVKRLPPAQIEAIDMGRRGIHDEGSRILLERLEGKVETDMATARRLFTLICALIVRG